MKDALQQRWQQLSPREKQWLRWLGGLFIVVLIWRIAIAPAQQSLNDNVQQNARLTQALASMQTMADQARRLQTQTPIPSDQSFKTLQSLTANTQGLQIKQQNQRVMVSLSSVSADDLAQWLTQSREQAKVIVLEAHLTPTGQNWGGTLILLLPSKERP